jgi:hypothetical protein
VANQQQLFAAEMDCLGRNSRQIFGCFAFDAGEVGTIEGKLIKPS